MNRKSITIIVIFSLLLTFVLPFQINIPSIYAKENARKIVYYDYNDPSYVINYVENISLDEDDSIKKTKKYFNENKLKATAFDLDINNKPSSSNYSDIAYPANYVKNNPDIQMQLNNDLENGKMVYLYGELSFKEYKEILGLDEMTITYKTDYGKNIEVDLTYVDEHNENKIRIPKYDIIGYSTVGLNTVFTSSINSHKELNEFNYFNEILYYMAYSLEKKEVNQKNISYNIFSKNNVLAAENITVDSSGDMDLFATAIGTYGTAGRLITQYELVQHPNESERDWDYFSLQHGVYYEVFNNYTLHSDGIDIKHSIMNEDDLNFGRPNTNTTSQWSISLSYPWGISLTWSTSDDVSIDHYFKDYNPEYNTWNINDDLNPNDNPFLLVSGFKSNTTISFFTYIDMEVDIKFKRGSYLLYDEATASDYYNVSYSYTAADSPGYN